MLYSLYSYTMNFGSLNGGGGSYSAIIKMSQDATLLAAAAAAEDCTNMTQVIRASILPASFSLCALISQWWWKARPNEKEWRWEHRWWYLLSRERENFLLWFAPVFTQCLGIQAVYLHPICEWSCADLCVMKWVEEVWRVDSWSYLWIQTWGFSWIFIRLR